MDVDYKNIPLDGIIDSPVDLRDYNYKDLSCNNNSQIPEKFEIEYPFEPRNQLNTSTCAFQSVSAIIETINNVNDYVSDGFLNAMRDVYDCQLGKGAVTREIMKLACNSGIVSKLDFPNLEDYPTISESFDKLSNKTEIIEKAKQLKCQSYVRVDIEDVPSYLFNEKKPLVVTTRLYESFYKVNKPNTDGLVPYPSYGERCGNHAMVIIGYKYINGQLYLKILNSWGKYWCLNGFCWINAKDDKLINEIWGFTDIPKRTTTTKYKIGWDKDKRSNKWIYSENGKTLIQNGWKEIKGEWYYFKNTFVIDGDWNFDNGWYYLEQGSCQMIKDSWQNINGDWYIFNEKGKMITGWYKDKNNDWFYLDNNGKMKTGWIFEGGKWYYLNPNSDGTKGKMIIGWLKEGECWYYLDIDKGYCYTNCTILIDGKYYTFNEKGQWVEDNSLVSNNLIEFIKGWESFYSKAYYDGYGNTDTYLTIGYGTTKTANQSAFPNGINSTCTKEQATTWLKDEVNKCANKIKNALGNTQISQNRFDCMVDIAYNAGVGSLIGGNTWRALISGNKSDIETYLMQWNKSNGKYSEGLNKRCRARVNMALYGVYNSTH